MTKPPYYKRQPRWHLSGSFCDGTYKLSEREIAAHLFVGEFPKEKISDKRLENFIINKESPSQEECIELLSELLNLRKKKNE